MSEDRHKGIRKAFGEEIASVAIAEVKAAREEAKRLLSLDETQHLVQTARRLQAEQSVAPAPPETIDEPNAVKQHLAEPEFLGLTTDAAIWTRRNLRISYTNVTLQGAKDALEEVLRQIVIAEGEEAEALRAVAESPPSPKCQMMYRRQWRLVLGKLNVLRDKRDNLQGWINLSSPHSKRGLDK